LKTGFDFRSQNSTRNKRLRSLLSGFNQTSSRFAVQELYGHYSETFFPLLWNLSRTGAFTGSRDSFDELNFCVKSDMPTQNFVAS
jgi:hypothetical protein